MEQLVRITSLLCTALITLSACTTTGTITDPPPESPAPSGPVTFANIYELRNGIESTGYTCIEWSILEQVLNAVERAHCTSSVTIGIHEDATQTQRSIESIGDLMSMLDRESHFATGPNWSVSCGEDEDLCSGLAEAFGGDLQSFPH